MEGKILGIPLAILLLVLFIVAPILVVQSVDLNQNRTISERLHQVELELINLQSTQVEPKIIDTPMEQATQSASVEDVEAELESMLDEKDEDLVSSPTPTIETFEEEAE